VLNCVAHPVGDLGGRSVEVGLGEVEVGLEAVGLELDCEAVGLDGLLILVGHVVHVAQVVEGRVVKWICVNCSQVKLDC